MNCSMRGMPSVSTLSTWVSPRWKRPVPWAVGRMSTSAESGRMSVVPRPSMRRPSLTMRLRTTCFCNERNAGLICLTRDWYCWGSSAVPASASSSPSRISSRRSLRAVLSAMDIASDVLAVACSATASNTSVS